LAEARGELIAFLDADDQWLPEKLQKQVDCLTASPEARMVHSDLVILDESNGSRYYSRRSRSRFSGECYAEFFRGNAVVPSTVVVSRDCIESVGRFDESIRGASTQDMDLWIRIARKFKIAYVDEPLVLYRHHSGNASRNQRMMFEDEYYVIAKALKADPKLWTMLGHAWLRERLSNLAFAAGYANVDADELRRARYYFREAMKYDRRRVRNWGFWASTFLTVKARARLRSAKQRLCG
jgi:glycosyltransferase involved in cell wall biosynthesis